MEELSTKTGRARRLPDLFTDGMIHSIPCGRSGELPRGNTYEAPKSHLQFFGGVEVANIGNRLSLVHIQVNTLLQTYSQPVPTLRTISAPYCHVRTCCHSGIPVISPAATACTCYACCTFCTFLSLLVPSASAYTFSRLM